VRLEDAFDVLAFRIQFDRKSLRANRHRPMLVAECVSECGGSSRRNRLEVDDECGTGRPFDEQETLRVVEKHVTRFEDGRSMHDSELSSLVGRRSNARLSALRARERNHFERARLVVAVPGRSKRVVFGDVSEYARDDPHQYRLRGGVPTPKMASRVTLQASWMASLTSERLSATARASTPRPSRSVDAEPRTRACSSSAS